MLHSSGKGKKMKELVKFETGNLSPQEIGAIFDTLPMEITFVDTSDTIRYYNKVKERIFSRTKEIIGRKVQQCHSPKSIHMVNRVIEDLKMGRKGSVDSWIDMQGKKILIRYFPVRNEKGEYLGCLEVAQEITEIQKLKGERKPVEDIMETQGKQHSR